MIFRNISLTSYLTGSSKCFPIVIMVENNKISNRVDSCSGFQHNDTLTLILKTTRLFRMSLLKPIGAGKYKVVDDGGGRLELILSL